MPSLIKGLARQERNCLSGKDVTMPQLWVLEYLSHEGPCRMSEIARFFNTSRPATTGIIERLINQKLVRREYNLCDRRLIMIGITSKGKIIIRNALNQKKRILKHMFGKISAQKRAQYLRILEEISEMLNASLAGKE